MINSLSQIYIPITKSELWDEDDSQKDRRSTIYAILAKTLKTIDILIHPFSPFTTQYLYSTTFGEKENILLAVDVPILEGIPCNVKFCPEISYAIFNAGSASSTQSSEFETS